MKMNHKTVVIKEMNNIEYINVKSFLESFGDVTSSPSSVCNRYCQNPVKMSHNGITSLFVTPDDAFEIAKVSKHDLSNDAQKWIKKNFSLSPKTQTAMNTFYISIGNRSLRAIKHNDKLVVCANDVVSHMGYLNVLRAMDKIISKKMLVSTINPNDKRKGTVLSFVTVARAKQMLAKLDV